MRLCIWLLRAATCVNVWMYIHTSYIDKIDTYMFVTHICKQCRHETTFWERFSSRYVVARCDDVRCNSRTAHGQSLVYLHAAAWKWLWPSRVPKPLLRILITPHIHTTPYYSSHTHTTPYIYTTPYSHHVCLCLSVCPAL